MLQLKDDCKFEPEQVEGGIESQGATPMRKMRNLKELYGKKGIT